MAEQSCGVEMKFVGVTTNLRRTAERMKLKTMLVWVWVYGLALDLHALILCVCVQRSQVEPWKAFSFCHAMLSFMAPAYVPPPRYLRKRLDVLCSGRAKMLR